MISSMAIFFGYVLVAFAAFWMTCALKDYRRWLYLPAGIGFCLLGIGHVEHAEIMATLGIVCVVISSGVHCVLRFIVDVHHKKMLSLNLPRSHMTFL